MRGAALVALLGVVLASPAPRAQDTRSPGQIFGLPKLMARKATPAAPTASYPLRPDCPVGAPFYRRELAVGCRRIQGKPILSATTLTLGTDGNAFKILGGAALRCISTDGWEPGDSVELTFSASTAVERGECARGSSPIQVGKRGFLAGDKVILAHGVGDAPWIEVRKPTP